MQINIVQIANGLILTVTGNGKSMSRFCATTDDVTKELACIFESYNEQIKKFNEQPSNHGATKCRR
jgi:hypothetical protein